MPATSTKKTPKTLGKRLIRALDGLLEDIKSGKSIRKVRLASHADGTVTRRQTRVRIHLSPGQRLKIYRERAQLTQQDLAQRVDSTQPRIAQFENGQRDLREAASQLVFQIAETVGATVEELIR